MFHDLTPLLNNFTQLGFDLVSREADTHTVCERADRDVLSGKRSLDDRPADEDALSKHYAWVCEIAEKTGVQLTSAEAQAALRSALADKCAKVLIDAGVYKNDEKGNAGVLRFLNSIGYSKK